MKKILYTVSALLITSGLFAQNLVDALRYSDHKIKGTARAAAMGNAFGALGADFTTTSINPAGLGLYRSNEFVFTSDLSKMSVDGTYLNRTSSDSKYNLSLDNVGYVATFQSNEQSSSSLVSFNVGVGFNRLGAFAANMLVNGVDAPNSILTGFTNRVNDDYLEAGDFDPFYEKLAYETYLMDYDPDNDVFFNDLTDAGYGHSQRKSTSRKGYINEYTVSFAANFNHKVYVGATFGIHDVLYEENTDLYEYDANNKIDYFNSLNFETKMSTTGTGFNAKLGVIFKPVDALRLGVALHTPTFYSLNDGYRNTMYSDMDLKDNVTGQLVNEKYMKSSPVGDYDYHLETPMKAVFSAAYIIGKKGLVSLDYEYVDYSTAKLRKGGNYNYAFTDENDEIKEVYKTVGNIRVGGEYRLNNVFSLRAGYEFYPSPYNKKAFGVDQPNSNSDYSSVSAGLGIKQGDFFVDLAYKYTMGEEHNTLYAGSDFAKYELNNNSLLLSVGFKF